MHQFNCPGGIWGAIAAAEVAAGNGTPDMVAMVDTQNKEWADAGLTTGQWATRLADGRLVAVGSSEHIAETEAFLRRFTTPDGKSILDQ